MGMLTVWYNTKCPVCDAGIKFQKNKLLRLVRDGSVEFRDINLEPEALAFFGSDVEAVRKWLHATRDGQLFKGIDVAIELWRLTPGQNWIAAAFGNPVMRPMARLGYNGFAELLYFWNKSSGHW